MQLNLISSVRRPIPRLVQTLPVAATLCLAACGVPYKLPAGVPTAEITVVNTLAASASLVVQDVTQCPSPQRAILASFDSQSNAQLLSVLSGKPFDSVRTQTKNISAHGWLALETLQDNCSVRVMFRPDEGGRYEATISGLNNQCTLKLLKLTKESSGKIRRDVDKTVFQVSRSGGDRVICAN